MLDLCSDKDMLKLGERIRKAREAKDLTQEKLAEMIGAKSRETISEWENGKRIPGMKKISQLCTALGIDIGHLFYEYDEPDMETRCVMKYTGLSEKTVNILHRWSERASDGKIGIPNKEAITALNALIETDRIFGDSVLLRIPEYVKWRGIQEMKQPKQFKGNNDTEKALSEAAYKDLKQKAPEKIDILLFSLSKGIADSIETIYKNRKKVR